jgi:DNA polymerase
MSNLVETRSAAILKRAGRPTPIYLNYYGAHTGRWSGGDGVNWQNLPKRGLGGELRKSLVAPEGHVLIIADAAQIEARTIFWHAGQHDMVEAFARGNDVYAIAATNTYGYEINKDDNPEERFVGKVLILSGIYGAGAPKINYTFKVGKNGPPLHQTMEQTEEALSGWRAANKYLVRHWYEQKKRATTAFMNLTDVDDGVVCFEGTKRGGYVHLPNGMYIFYPKVYWDEDTQGMAYNGRNGTVNMWHGLIAENVNQAIARVALGEQMVTMEDELRNIRFASTTHDEVIIVAPIKKAEHYAEIVHRIMSTPPAWAEGLPLNADVHISEIYDKT